MSGEIRSVIVAGTGPLPWIAAAGLSRAFRHRQLDVTVVDSGASCDARVGRWTLPSQRGMHALLGIPEGTIKWRLSEARRQLKEQLSWMDTDRTR